MRQVNLRQNWLSVRPAWQGKRGEQQGQREKFSQQEAPPLLAAETRAPNGETIRDAARKQALPQ
jgi:hypothetical protein